MAPTSDPAAGSVWLRPDRSRRGRPQLSRDEIVRAAVELLDAEGLDGLSMRRLAAMIGAGATSLYFYVANKDELLELVLDEVMGEVAVPDVAGGDWRAAAAEFSRGMRAMILRHPWTTAILGEQPNIGPRAMRTSDRAIAMFRAAGFRGPEIAWAGSLLMSHAVGTATGEVAYRRVAARSGADGDQVGEQLGPYLEQAGAAYPNFLEWWRENRDRAVDMRQNHDDTFEFGLRRLLDGLEAWLTAPPTEDAKPREESAEDAEGAGD
ncbi:TetR/AcrR family transcriptional regulator [Actinomadura fibrosa]|uniref:TetR/AcrR family transcriptional regulator n=1 Tax=Actinomadura fibrosa TaxID=111802 RepID=A0ABW2XQ55_9ACTN|nr:TetR/AcrR family transcriptional regulator [Actinomadura fibrosa]